jgi:uncharacterized protein YndB with AHSA1/START domain
LAGRTSLGHTESGARYKVGFDVARGLVAVVRSVFIHEVALHQSTTAPLSGCGVVPAIRSDLASLTIGRDCLRLRGVKTIHHLVDIDASPSSVWAALTQQDRMAGWWSTRVLAPDAAAGTLVHWTFTGDFNPVMEVIESQEPSRLVWRCASGHEPWHDSTFRFDITAIEDSRTRVRFWQEYAVELADDYYATYNFNWGYYLESLRLLCSTGTGKPFHAE